MPNSCAELFGVLFCLTRMAMRGGSEAARGRGHTETSVVPRDVKTEPFGGTRSKRSETSTSLFHTPHLFGEVLDYFTTLGQLYP